MYVCTHIKSQPTCWSNASAKSTLATLDGGGLRHVRQLVLVLTIWYHAAHLSRHACSFQYSSHGGGLSVPPPLM